MFCYLVSAEGRKKRLKPFEVEVDGGEVRLQHGPEPPEEVGGLIEVKDKGFWLCSGGVVKDT